MRNLIKFILLVCASVAFAQAPKNGTFVDVWPYGKVQGQTPNFAQVLGGKSDNVIVKNVSNPTFELFLVKSEKPTGVVIVCPGGAYKVVMYDHEGTKIAKALNEAGISAVVLKYRIPDLPQEALADIQRTIRVLRANAKDWQINPNKIAVMGFSAGANLSVRASTQFKDETYKPIDATDSLSARPDLACIIYPAYCSEPDRSKRFDKPPAKASNDYNGEYKIASNLSISSEVPPTFMMQTGEDPYLDNSIAYYLALKNAKVPVQLHLFDKGVHGIGVNKSDLLACDWIRLCSKWLLSKGINK